MIPVRCLTSLGAWFLASAGLASAATVDFTFKAVTAEVSVNGGPTAKVDLSVDLLANTANLQPGEGYGSSDRYVNLKGFFSSKALGLSNVEAVTPLDVHIGAPAADAIFRNSTVLLVSGDVVNGIFSMPAIGSWDRVSYIGPLNGPATSSAPLRVVLKNGDTLSMLPSKAPSPTATHPSSRMSYRIARLKPAQSWWLAACASSAKKS
jgi:hypothetical protein